jgi:hypothetical protein
MDILKFINFVGPPVLAFLLGSLVSYWNLVTSKYPRTHFLIRGYRPLKYYCGVYGISAIVIVLLVQVGALIVNIPSLSSVLGRWVLAVLVGVFIKTFVETRLSITVTIGNRSVPIGIDTFVRLFEPRLLGYIHEHEFYKVREFLKPSEQQYTNLSDVKARILNALPPQEGEAFGAERKAFLLAINEAENIGLVMGKYLRHVGKQNFELTFPNT